MPARRVDEVIELVGLARRARRKAGGFSLGMRQRLGIAAAMLGDPPVMIMDEPFNGMDPEGIIWMRHFLRSLAAEGRAILVSSHLMGELQDMADQVVVVGRGKVLADASVDELVARASGDQVLLRTPEPAEAAAALQRAGAAVTVIDRNTLSVSGTRRPAGRGNPQPGRRQASPRSPPSGPRSRMSTSSSPAARPSSGRGRPRRRGDDRHQHPAPPDRESAADVGASGRCCGRSGPSSAPSGAG